VSDQPLAVVGAVFQSTPTGFPAGDRHPRQDDHQVRRVSIHADRFPGRRHSVRIVNSHFLGWFQSTPTGFPAGDAAQWQQLCVRQSFQSTPTGFPAGDFSGHRVVSRLARFNPRRPVSRPATDEADRHAVDGGLFQSTPTGFPAGDLSGCATGWTG